MTNNKKLVSLGIFLCILLGAVYLFKDSPIQVGVAGDCENYTCFTTLRVLEDLQVDSTFGSAGAFSLSGTFQLGANGSVQSQQIATTCHPTVGVSASVAATSTAYISCVGVTGVTSASQVIAQFSTSTNAIGARWALLGSKASSTAGAVDLKIMNLTGTAAVPEAASAAAFSSSTKLWVVN